MLWWTSGYMCLFQFWFPPCVCPIVGLLGHKAVLFFFFNFYFILEKSWLTMICYLQMYSKVIWLYQYQYTFSIFLLFWLLQNIELSSLCYIAGLCWLYILNIVVCQSQTPKLSFPCPFFLVTINSFSKSVFLFYK